MLTAASQVGTPRLIEGPPVVQQLAEVDDLKTRFGEHEGKVTALLIQGTTVEKILQERDRLQADLIVLGSHGRHGLALLLGSTANGVLHHAKCDVLAVRLKDD